MIDLRVFKMLNCHSCFFNAGKPKSIFPKDKFCGFDGEIEIDGDRCLSKEKHDGDREYLRG